MYLFTNLSQFAGSSIFWVTQSVGQMNPGDVVEVKIDKIGTLRNFVVTES